MRWRDRYLSISVAVAVLVSPIAGRLWLGSHSPLWVPAVLVVPAAVLIWVVITLFVLGMLAPSRLVQFATVSSALVVLCAAAVAVQSERGPSPGLRIELLAAVTAGLLLVRLAAGLFTAMSDYGRRADLPNINPDAALLLDWALVSAKAVEWAHPDPRFRASRQRWGRPVPRQTTTHDLLVGLEDVASRAETCFARDSGSRRPTSHLKKWGDRGRRIAAVVRKHQEKVVELEAFDRLQVAHSLLLGLGYLVRGGWESLLVAEPAPPIRSFLRRVGRRVGLAAILVVAAFAVPALFSERFPDPGAFQTIALITAVASLISPDPHKAADALTPLIRLS